MEPESFSLPKMTMAVMTGQWDEVKLLVANKYPLNEGDGQSGLRLACKGHLPTVKLLFENGADINYDDTSSMGSTPLLSACHAGNLEIATFLIENGAKVNHRDEMGIVPLSLQICGPNPNPKLVAYLIKQGADPNAKDENDRPVIIQAKLKRLDKIVEILLENKAVNEEPTSEEVENARSNEENDENDEEGYGDEDEDKGRGNGDENTEFSVGFAMTQIGTSYLYYDEDYEAAVDYFNQAIDADPEYQNAYLHAIKAYTLLGEQDVAEKYKKLFKDQFGIEADAVDYEAMLEEQERQRDVYMNSLPNVTTIRL